MLWFAGSRMRCGRSAAADRVDDFDLIAIDEGAGAVLAARDDLPVNLHCNTPPGVAGFVEQLGDRGMRVAVAWTAVERNRHSYILAGLRRALRWMIPQRLPLARVFFALQERPTHPSTDMCWAGLRANASVSWLGDSARIVAFCRIELRRVISNRTSWPFSIRKPKSAQPARRMVLPPELDSQCDSRPSRTTFGALDSSHRASPGLPSAGQAGVAQW